MGALFHFEKTLPGLPDSGEKTQVEVFTHANRVFLQLQNPKDSAIPLTAELNSRDAQELLEGIRKALSFLGLPSQ